MEQLKRMALFATVVARGSMVGAAETLGMTASAVSQQVRRLEEATGVTLLHRTTRKLTLTEAGATFYESCRQIVELDFERLAQSRRDYSYLGERRFVLPGEMREHESGLRELIIPA